MIPNRPHLIRVDILRAVAIIAVFFYHAQNSLFPGYKIETYTSNHLLQIVNAKSAILNLAPTAFGWTGVELFLLISGFLINLGYLTNNSCIDFSSFYRRRFWRIYPPYLLVLLFVCFAKNGIVHFLFTREGLWELVSHLFLVHNLSNKTFFAINASFWSLALEAQLYLLYPVFLFIRKKKGIQNTLFLLLLLSIVSLLIGLCLPDLEKGEAYNASVIRYWFVWGAGAWLGEAYYNRQRIFTKYPLLLALVGMMLTIGSHLHLLSSHITLHLATFTWLVFFEWFLYTKAVNTSTLLARGLTMIGLCSYSIYLIHQPYLAAVLQYFTVFYYSPNQSMVFGLLRLFPAFMVFFLVGYSLYLLVEIPSIDYGKKRRAGKVL